MIIRKLNIHVPQLSKIGRILPNVPFDCAFMLPSLFSKDKRVFVSLGCFVHTMNGRNIKNKEVP